MAARLQEAFSSGAGATPEIDAAADALEAVRLEADTPVSSGGEGRKRAPRKRKPHGAKKENGGAAGSGEAKQGQQGQQSQQGGQGQQRKKENGDGSKRQNRPRAPKKDSKDAAASGPDEDGFQVQRAKTRTNKTATRGRGGRPAGTGGRQQGQKENGAAGKPRQNKDSEQQPPKPKPSIYKETQPSGPSSAPIF